MVSVFPGMWNRLCADVTKWGKIRSMYSAGIKCTNNQAEYEGLLASLELLAKMQVRDVEAFRDSKLVVQ
jgi:ribonuclease HI